MIEWIPGLIALGFFVWAYVSIMRAAGEAAQTSDAKDGGPVIGCLWLFGLVGLIIVLAYAWDRISAGRPL